MHCSELKARLKNAKYLPFQVGMRLQIWIAVDALLSYLLKEFINIQPFTWIRQHDVKS